MKKIIHFQIPVNENGIPTINISNLGNYVNLVNTKLPEDYISLFSPFKVQIEGEKINLIEDNYVEPELGEKFYDLINEEVKEYGFIVELLD